MPTCDLDLKKKILINYVDEAYISYVLSEIKFGFCVSNRNSTQDISMKKYIKNIFFKSFYLSVFNCYFVV